MRTKFMRVSLPTWERERESNLDFQLCNLAETLSMRSWKSSTLLPLCLKVTPRYLEGWGTSFTPSTCDKAAIWWLVILGEQKSSDLSRLMLWLDRLQYHAIVFWIAVADLLSFLKKKKESSANNRCDRGWVAFPILMPFRCFSLSYLSRA